MPPGENKKIVVIAKKKAMATLCAYFKFMRIFVK